MSNAPSIIVPRHMQAAPKSVKVTRLIENDNKIDLSENPDVKRAKLESWIARNIAAILEKTFPFRTWRVGVDTIGGIATVQCPELAADRAYFMHLEGKNIHDLQEQAKQAAGELLERFNVTRSKNFDPGVIEEMEQDVKGNVVTDDSRAESITGNNRVLKHGER